MYRGKFLTLADMTVPDIKALSKRAKAYKREIQCDSRNPAALCFRLQDPNTKINESALLYNLNKQTVRKYLCLYLVYQTRTVFLPRKMKTDLNFHEMKKEYALGIE